MQKGIGVICLVIGVLLLVWGHRMSQSIGSQLQNAFTGSPGDQPMHLYIAGTAAGLFGLLLIFWKRK